MGDILANLNRTAHLHGASAGTSAKPARGAPRHTSLQSCEVVAAAAVADSDAPEVVAAGTGACLSSSSSSLLLLLLSFRGCRDTVRAPTR